MATTVGADWIDRARGGALTLGYEITPGGWRADVFDHRSGERCAAFGVFWRIEDCMAAAKRWCDEHGLRQSRESTDCYVLVPTARAEVTP